MFERAAEKLGPFLNWLSHSVWGAAWAGWTAVSSVREAAEICRKLVEEGRVSLRHVVKLVRVALHFGIAVAELIVYLFSPPAAASAATLSFALAA
jgi:hypothetical protein